MKASKYNVYIMLENGDFLLYNTLYKKKAIIDNEMRDSIDDCAIDDEDVKKTLLQCGFIVEDDIDELKIVQSKRLAALARNFSEQVGISFVVTYKCNLACTYCYEQGIRSLGGMMDQPIIDDIFTFVRRRIERKNSINRFVFRLYGGEPLLNWKGCSYILDCADTLCQEYGILKNGSLISNASLFTDEIWDVLSSFGLEKLQITIDGFKEDHDKRRMTQKGEGTYDIIMRNIGKAIDHGITPELRVNLDNYNYENIGLLFDDLKERGYEHVNIQFGIISQLHMHCPSDRIDYLSSSALSDVLPSIWNEAETRGFHILDELNPTFVFCQFDLLDFFVIDSFLDVYKCWDLIGMKEHKIGKIVNGEFYPEYRYYDSTSRDVIQFNGCCECDLLPLCMGSCAARAYDNFGTYHAPGCFQERFVIEEKLKRFVMKKVNPDD